MKWIKIDDKSPEEIENLCDYDYVLVLGKQYKNSYPLIALAQMVNGKWSILGDIGAYGDVGEVEFKSEYVTYWARVEYPED